MGTRSTAACNTRCYVSLHQGQTLTAFYKWSNNSPLYRDQLSETIKTTKEKKRGGGGGGAKKIERQLITTIIFKTNQKVSSCFLNITVPAIFDYEFDTRQLQQVS